MDINGLGGVLASQYALPHMLEAGKGSIIFTSSSISLGGDLAQFSYGSSKAAMNWFVKAFAVNFGKKGIRCNGILPRSEEHTSELQSLMRISYAVFCLKKKTNKHTKPQQHT